VIEPALSTPRVRRTALELVGGPALALALLAAGMGLGPGVLVAAAALVGSLAVGHGLSRRAARRRGRRRITQVHVGVRVVQVAAGCLLALAALSWTRAILRPSNSSIGIRSVEWVRDNGGAWLVNDIERAYYSLDAPAKGGPALRNLPVAGVAVQPRQHAPRASHHRARRRRRTHLPKRVRPVIAPRLPGEGSWRTTRAQFSRAAEPPILITSYRPDPSYPRVVAGLAWFDHRRTRVSLYPGIQEPPGGGSSSGGQVPDAHRRALLATFNGGFKHADGHGGFFSAGRLLEPLIPGQGSIVVRSDGRVDVRAWRGGARPGPGITTVRQNLPLIVDRGRPNPNLSDGPEWGATLGNAILVWRSGVGVDRHGNLIYAAAPEQTVSGLAQILIHAGAVRAVELDINSYWVTLNTYSASGARGAQPLLPTMQRPATRYLSPDDRDFFAVYAR